MIAILAVLLAIAVLLPSAFAQREMYPQKEGIQQSFHFDEIPKWMTLDMELRGRTEEQTPLGYVSGKDRLYELTRVWGGLTVRPTDWLTGYLQFLDTHALGLPLRDVAANMRDVFDFRQGYLDFHYEAAQPFVGRQELKFGDERVVGISDWTNNSRTWDWQRTSASALRTGSTSSLHLSLPSIPPASTSTAPEPHLPRRRR